MRRRPAWLANKGGAPAAKSKAATSAIDAANDAFARFYKQLNVDSPDGLQSATGKENDDDNDEEGKEGGQRHSPKSSAPSASGEQGGRVLRLFVRSDSEYHSVHGDAAYFVADEYNRTRVDIKSDSTTARTLTQQCLTDCVLHLARRSAACTVPCLRVTDGAARSSWLGSTCAPRR